ncbi:MAG: hypothetical protein GDA54_01630 [Alphaproteobacteria bacterium GM7ARS4]|nr:hypothetical protein [Alphaproteobacteria bacterium GM7ARS4]
MFSWAHTENIGKMVEGVGMIPSLPPSLPLCRASSLSALVGQHALSHVYDGRALERRAPESCSCGVLEGEGYVLFSNDTHLWWLHFLKQGFRHCAIVLIRDGVVLFIDPLSHQLIIEWRLMDDRECFLKALERCGVRYVPVSFHEVSASQAPLSFFSCVEVVKRVLGIHRRWIITPWQLYQFLLDNPRK